VIQDGDSLLVHGREDLLLGTAPFQFGDRLCHLGLERGTGVPTITRNRALSRHLLASPHHNVAIFRTSRQNASAVVV